MTLFLDNIIAIYDILNAVKNNTNDIFNSVNYVNNFVELIDDEAKATKP